MSKDENGTILMIKGFGRELLIKLKDQATKERRTIKAVTIKAVEEYLERKGDKTNEE